MYKMSNTVCTSSCTYCITYLGDLDIPFVLLNISSKFILHLDCYLLSPKRHIKISKYQIDLLHSPRSVIQYVHCISDWFITLTKISNTVCTLYITVIYYVHTVLLILVSVINHCDIQCTYCITHLGECNKSLWYTMYIL
jgi:uncharacterized radical SAM superfamily Fe-S cluster-containing enzyme